MPDNEKIVDIFRDYLNEREKLIEDLCNLHSLNILDALQELEKISHTIKRKLQDV